MSDEEKQEMPANNVLMHNFMTDLGRSKSTFDGFHEMCRMASVNPFIMCLTSMLIEEELKQSFPDLFEMAQKVHETINEGQQIMGNPHMKEKLEDFARQRYVILSRIMEEHGVKVEKPSPLILPK